MNNNNKYPINDPRFNITLLSSTYWPNMVCYLAMHQCYTSNDVGLELEAIAKKDEVTLGKRLVEKCIKYGHWGVLEHASFTFCVAGFPHSVLVQARTHRVGVSFAAQSQRYTGDVIAENAINIAFDDPDYNLLEDVMYFRPSGFYTDRNGRKYEYNDTHREEDMALALRNIKEYRHRVTLRGHSPEHARDMLFQNVRQNFVVTFNARSLLHFCDLRIPADAQPEIRTMAMMLFDEFESLMPEVGEEYRKKRYSKNKLAP